MSTATPQSAAGTGQLLATLGPALRGSRGALASAILLGVAARWVFLPLPFLLRRMLHSDLVEPRGAGGMQWPDVALTALLAMALMRALLTWGGRVQAERAAQAAIAALRRQMTDHLLRLKLNYFDRRASGKVLLRFVSDANALKAFIASRVVTLSADIPTLVAILALMFVISWKVGVASCLPLPAAAYLFWRFNPILRSRVRAARREQSNLCAHLTDRLGMMDQVKANTAEPREADTVRGLVDIVAEANLRRARAEALPLSLTTGLITLNFGIVLWVGGYQVLAGTLPSADLFALVLLCAFLQGPIQRCTAANTATQRARVAVNRIQAFLSHPADPSRLAELPPLAAPYRVEIDHVALRYSSKARWVFTDLSVSMQGPALVVLDGPVGAGKSALLGLILRLRQPQRGAVRINGFSLRTVGMQSVRRQIGWLPQEVALVPGTVGDNVRYAAPQLTDQEVDAWLVRTAGLDAGGAARLTCEHPVSGLGRNLSPLQRVQVALARALAPEPPIVLLDDPTAHMRPADEERLRELLGDLRKRCLVVTASSRDWIVREADQHIYVNERPIAPDLDSNSRAESDEAVRS